MCEIPYSDKDIPALLKLVKDIKKHKWVVATAARRKSLGKIDGYLPKIQGDDDLFFNYPNYRAKYKSVVEEILNDFLKDF